MLAIIKKKTFVPDFEKDLHYISWTPRSNNAVSGYAALSYVYGITVCELDLDMKSMEAMFWTIDKNGETGSFYPFKNITIMPNHGIYSDEQIDQHFGDAMKAQNQYIQAKNIIFDMRFYEYYNPHTKRYDNPEYLRRISLEYSLMRQTGRTENWFVIVSQDMESPPVGYVFATESDYAHLLKPRA